MIKADDSAAICARIEIGCARDSHGNPITINDGMGWVHDLVQRDEIARYTGQPKQTPKPEVKLDCDSMLIRFLKAMTAIRLKSLAQSLGVHHLALALLCVGWSEQHNAYAFPMRDSEEQVIGFRLRNDEGRKWAVKDSRSGLFIAQNVLDAFSDSPMFVCEGPTDTAALLSLELYAVGRPSCRGGAEYVVQVAKRVDRPVVLISDNDGPGVEGAQALADKLLEAGCVVSIIQPPWQHKDIREWLTGQDKMRERMLYMAKYGRKWTGT